MKNIVLHSYSPSQCCLLGHVSSQFTDARMKLCRETQLNGHVKRNLPNQAELPALTGNS